VCDAGLGYVFAQHLIADACEVYWSGQYEAAGLSAAVSLRVRRTATASPSVPSLAARRVRTQIIGEQELICPRIVDRLLLNLDYRRFRGRFGRDGLRGPRRTSLMRAVRSNSVFAAAYTSATSSTVLFVSRASCSGIEGIFEALCPGSVRPSWRLLCAYVAGCAWCAPY